MHVHVGIDDPDKAIHVANGMCVHLPVLLGLSANSPFWRADATGMASTRTPIFRAFPRVGIPPAYDDWADYERRIEFMIQAGVIEDYTYLWHDVRPHPNFGTVEVRVMDSPDPRRALARARRAGPGAGPRARRALRLRQEPVALPVRDARREQVARRPPRARRRAGRPPELRAGRDPHAGAAPARPDARALRRPRLASPSSKPWRTCSRAATAPRSQVVVYEANHDFREVMAEIVAATPP